MIIDDDGEVLGSVLRSAVPGAKPDEGSQPNASDDFSVEAHIAPPPEDDLEPQVAARVQEEPAQGAPEGKQPETAAETGSESKQEPPKPEPKKAPVKAPATGLKSALDKKD